MAVLVLGAGTIVGGMRSEDRRQARRYEAWHVDGPQCSTIPSAAAQKAAHKITQVEDVTVARETGHLTCFEIRDHAGHGPGTVVACHLTSPGVVFVSGQAGTFGFDPGLGRPAAIFVSRTGASCVKKINPALFSASNDRPYD